MESASLAVIRQMQGSEASAKGIWAVVKAWDSSPKVKVVHWANQSRHRGRCESSPLKIQPFI